MADTIRQYYAECRRVLADILGSEGEGDGAARIIFEDIAGYTPAFIFANGDRTMQPETEARIEAVIAKVSGGQPVQYAIGKAQFMGNDYIVTPAVLIPRPETAALVDMIVENYSGRTDLAILDIGTGSGCIAISLARALPFCHVTAIDISTDALSVARTNAKALKVNIDLEKADILTATPPMRPLYDIIVSNPPYIAESERKEMEALVLDYEPSSALFVPDKDPLLFYRAIAVYAKAALKPAGRIFLEINSRFPAEVCRLLTENGFDNATATRDYRGLYRYASATKA